MSSQAPLSHSPLCAFSFLSLLALTTPTLAGWQVQCFSRLIDARLDPIVNPGANNISSHVHVIMGGNGFSSDMTYETARASSCLTCNVREDLSNYWTSKLYYKASNGSFLDVPIEGDNQYGNMGGMAVYYNDHRYNDEQVLPFPENFRMLTGTSSSRSANPDPILSKAITFECIDSAGNVKYPSLPNRKCSSGLVAELIMPSCWDGVNADSQDHKSHVSYPEDQVEGGKCPDTHPKRLMTMTYKITYRTDAFKDEWEEGGDKQPFVFANGDATGFGFHGDFVNGWDIQTLAQAANSCPPTLVPDGNRCQPSYTGPDKIFTHVMDQGEAYKCKLPVPAALQAEQVRGVLPALPGCNDVTYGPQDAPKAFVCPVSGDKSGDAGEKTVPSPSSLAAAAASAPTKPSSNPLKEDETAQVQAIAGDSAPAPAAYGNPIVSAIPSPSITDPASTPSPSLSPSSSPSSDPNAAPPSTPYVPTNGGSKSSAVDMSPKGYAYYGCASDSPMNRTLAEKSLVANDMSVGKCIDFCKDGGYAYAGMEWGIECYCSNTLPPSRAPTAVSEANCTQICGGDISQVCGGTNALSVYRACVQGEPCGKMPASRVYRYMEKRRLW